MTPERAGPTPTRGSGGSPAVAASATAFVSVLPGATTGSAGVHSTFPGAAGSSTAGGDDQPGVREQARGQG